MNKLENVGCCEFCNKVKLDGTYWIYRLSFRTNRCENYSVGILNIADELGDYLIKRGSHLSATQVMLLRPDITLDFLKKKYDNSEEKVLDYGLWEAEICKACFKEYIKEVPER
jgi:hypothetical protein